jgi:hypothetical protein
MLEVKRHRIRELGVLDSRIAKSISMTAVVKASEIKRTLTMSKLNKAVNSLMPLEAAYLAGITAYLHKGYVNGSLQVGRVNKEFLESLRKLVGTGSMASKGRRSKKAKILYVWQVQMKSLPKLLPQIIPYLRLKKRQAELMLGLAEYSEHPTVFNAEDAFQSDVISQFRQLNRRGEVLQSN